MSVTVSIGIPTYNRSRMLRQAIQSILQQTDQDFEIIVSDDCSTDDTPEIVRTFQDRRIRYHRTASNLHPPRNWNECARLAQGEFFALLPDDDVYCPEFLSEMVNSLETHPDVGMAQCGYYQVDENLRPLNIALASSISFTKVGEDALKWQFEHLSCIPASVLFRRAVMVQMGLWREDYWDDWALILRSAYRHGFTFVPQALSANRVHAQNLNRLLHIQQRDSILDIVNQHADIFGEALPVTSTLLALRAELNRQLSHQCMLLMLSALKRRNWAAARFHFSRARQLYPLAGIDPGFIRLGLAAQLQARHAAQQRSAARTKEPILQLETTT